MASNDPTAHLSRKDVEGYIYRLVDSLVNIKDESGEFLLKLEDGRIIDPKGWNDWEWTHGVGLYGLLKLHEITGDEYALKIALKWFADRLPVGTTKNVNTMAPLLTAAYLQERGYAQYTAYLDSWAEWVMHAMPRTEECGLQHITYVAENFGELWDDTLMMSVLPLAKIGLVLNRPHYVEEAKRQFILHTKYLADRETGLWFTTNAFPGWTFDGRNNFANARWARGNCWVTIAIPDFIELLNLPPGDGLREFLVGTLKAQIDAIVKYQDPKTGLWHTLIDDPTSYVESSASAGFAYGILKAMRMRLLPNDPAYLSSAKKAVAAVIKCISPKGELEQCSYGTPIFKDLDEYRKIPITSMPYGQALGLLTLTEQLRAYL